MHPYVLYERTKLTEFTPIDSALKYKDHIIVPNDELQVLLYPNKGELLLDPETIESRISAIQGGTVGTTITGRDQYSIHNYRILNDSTVNLPLIGKTKIAGMTIADAEKFLQELFGTVFHEPHLMLFVQNKKVFVYAGSREGTVQTFSSPNPTLIEVLTELKGVIGRSNTIYIVRNTFGEHQLFHIDLSVAENIELGSIVLQSNDVVYVYPRRKIAGQVLENLTPYLTLAITLLLTFNLFR